MFWKVYPQVGGIPWCKCQATTAYLATWVALRLLGIGTCRAKKGEMAEVEGGVAHLQ